MHTGATAGLGRPGRLIVNHQTSTHQQMERDKARKGNYLFSVNMTHQVLICEKELCSILGWEQTLVSNPPQDAGREGQRGLEKSRLHAWPLPSDSRQTRVPPMKTEAQGGPSACVAMRPPGLAMQSCPPHNFRVETGLKFYFTRWGQRRFTVVSM